MLLDIERLYLRLSKHLRIKTEHWATKLNEDCFNPGIGSVY